MDKNKLNHNADRGSNKQQQLYLNIAFFGVFACAALIFLLLAFDKIPPVSEHKKAEKETLSTEAQSETGTESATPKETLAAEASITISRILTSTTILMLISPYMVLIISSRM